jgi:putative PIN family toxin of toxin-antitoxin system
MNPHWRLVLDTNIWFDCLVFDDPGILLIRDALVSKRAEIYIDAACEAELARALAYDLGKWTLDEAAHAACVADCARMTRQVESTGAEAERAKLPVCSDPDDQKFLELALAANADFLVTKDRALLDLARCRTRPTPFKIVTPKQLAAYLAAAKAA